MRTLKSQIMLALGLMASLFAAAILYALHIVDDQRADDHLLRLGSELRLLQQQLSMQAMTYKENAPRDYASYFRDTRIYYQELVSKRTRLDAIIEAFAEDRLPASLRPTHGPSPAGLDLSDRSQQLAMKLSTAWSDFSGTLDQKLGDSQEPRLEWAAEWILAQHTALEDIAQAFLDSLEHEIERRASRAHDIARLLLTTGLLVALLIVFWFYRRVLRPLHTAVDGFKLVATGNFSHRVKADADNEIGWLITAFNQLTERLDAILELLTRLQQTKTLDESLEMLSIVLPRLVPTDWVGMLMLTPNGSMKLERAYSDGKPDGLAEQAFKLEGTLLEECLHNGSPLHIADVQEVARLDNRYRFLSVLGNRGRHDAVFMPVLGNDPKVGVLVLACRPSNSYRPEQIQLLHNLSPLFSATFGRTVALVEGSRLASIGQFASGIVHEIRTPLATISMALEHFQNVRELPKNARRRADLAHAESQRLTRLLDEILLYAKPFTPQLEPVTLSDIIVELEGLEVTSHPLLTIDHAAIVAVPAIPMDRDRIRQVLINLLSNAIEANGSDRRGIHLGARLQEGALVIEIDNGGDPITPEQMKRLFEPFYTSKAAGTGLGLSIVQRIIEAHGGHIEVTSSAAEGTRVSVSLPTQAQLQPAYAE